MSCKIVAVDHNIFIAMKTIIRNNNNAKSLLEDFAYIIKSICEFYTVKNKYQQDFSELNLDEKFIEDCSDIDELKFRFVYFCLENDVDLYKIFQNDDDRENDISLIAFVWEKQENNSLLIHRENKIKDVCDTLGLKNCCFANFLDEIGSALGGEFAELRKIIMDTNSHKINHPKWAITSKCQCI